MNTRLNRVWAAAAAGVLAAIGMTGAHAVASPTAAAPAIGAAVVVGVASDTPDQLIFKDGRIIEGKVLEETATHVRFLVVVSGISGEQTYNKADILAIERGVAEDAEDPQMAASATVGTAERPDNPDAADEADENAPGVYVVEFKGEFGRDITMTPIRAVVKDIAKHRPDYLVIIADNAWTFSDGSDAPDDVGAAFSRIFRAEDIEPIFTAEMPQILGYTPKTIVWVKTAMGGMAFLPFNFDNMYFSSDARMGGIGNLLSMYGSTGDEMVREKLFSALLAHAEGMAIRGGYDPRIIRAMARTDYVLSYRIDSGRAVLVEGEPNTDIGEHLLTENGTISGNKDSDRQLARGEGDDTLTLNAEVASVLGVSMGTVDELDDLLYELEIDREHRLIEGRSERILKDWTKSLATAERTLKQLWREMGQIQVQGERRERITARARQMRTLDKIIQLLTKYAEVDEIRLLKRPAGLPGIPALRVQREQIRQEQMKDR